MKRNPITTLLLVEDNLGDARLLREMFNEQGSHRPELTHVENMSEAEKHLAAHAVDVILLDLGLPDAQGLGAVRRTHAAAPHVPLVVLTGLDDESLAIQALQEGAQDYLVKGQVETRGLPRALRYAVERKNMEEALFAERKRSEEGWSRLAAIHEATTDLVSISDPEGRLLYVNRGGRRMLGLGETADIAGYTVADFLPNAATHVIATDGVPTAVRDGIWSGEAEMVRLDGSTISISQILLAHKRPDGSVEFLSTIARDITERKRTDEALRASENSLRQAQKMEAVGQLAAGVAHEFNNLLQALMSMAAIMRLRADTPEVAKIGTEMEFQIKRGASLTQQLLLFSRHHAIETSDIDLRGLIQEASVLLRRLIPENIRIVVETSPERLSVEGDAGQMQQVLLNLAINARDAMPDGGTLTLRAGSCPGEVFLEIEDTGQGMDEATRAHLFEPFFTTKEPGKGTGLGLAVVHGIVQEHGGRIEVLSRPGEGSRFRVTLPAVFSEGLTTREASEDVEVSAGSGRVLLVEDEEAVRTGIAVLLEAIGYEVMAVGSGEEAIAIPLVPAPDLLLSDVTLPGIAGLALGERLHERWPSLKIVLMSGYIEEALRASASERGWHFLQKPFEMTDLASHLRAALDGHTPGTLRKGPPLRVSDLATIQSRVA